MFGNWLLVPQMIHLRYPRYVPEHIITSQTKTCPLFISWKYNENSKKQSPHMMGNFFPEHFFSEISKTMVRLLHKNLHFLDRPLIFKMLFIVIFLLLKLLWSLVIINYWLFFWKILAKRDTAKKHVIPVKI